MSKVFAGENLIKNAGLENQIYGFDRQVMLEAIKTMVNPKEEERIREMKRDEEKLFQ